MSNFLGWLTQLADDGLGGVLVILLPLGMLVFVAACAALVWAVRSQQFDNLDVEARRILFDDRDGASPRVPGARPATIGRPGTGSDTGMPAEPQA